jgi:hypothetical protein
LQPSAPGRGRSPGERGRISNRQGSVSSDAGHFATSLGDHSRSLLFAKQHCLDCCDAHPTSATGHNPNISRGVACQLSPAADMLAGLAWAGLAASTSFGSSTILGSRIVKVEPRPSSLSTLMEADGAPQVVKGGDRSIAVAPLATRQRSWSTVSLRAIAWIRAPRSLCAEREARNWFRARPGSRKYHCDP